MPDALGTVIWGILEFRIVCLEVLGEEKSL